MSDNLWKEVSLGEICQFKYGKSLPGASREPGLVVVYGSNGPVGAHSVPITDGPTIVVGRKGSFGEVAYADSSCWPIDTTYYIDSSATNTDLRWLYYRLGTIGLKELNRAAAVPGLNREDAYRKRLLLPPIEDQRRIAKVLDQAGMLRAKRRQAIALLDDLAKSIFLDMFGDPGANPKNWPVTSLTKLIANGPQNGLYKPASSYGSGVPIVRIDAFYHGVITKLNSLKRLQVSYIELKRWMLHPGDVLINRVNSLEYLGKSALVPDLREPTVFESNMMRFSVDEDVLHPRFLVEVLQSAYIRSQVLSKAKNAVNQSSINQSDVCSLKIFVPPRERQQKYVTELERIDSLRETALRNRTKLDELFSSLQKGAFRGEL